VQIILGVSADAAFAVGNPVGAVGKVKFAVFDEPAAFFLSSGFLYHLGRLALFGSQQSVALCPLAPQILHSPFIFFLNLPATYAVSCVFTLLNCPKTCLISSLILSRSRFALLYCKYLFNMYTIVSYGLGFKL
jgi:hypothetical protein